MNDENYYINAFKGQNNKGTNSKQKKCINEILSILKKHQMTPTQVRYIFKKVRENGNYQKPKSKRKLPDFLNPAEIYHIRTVINEHFTPQDMFMFDFMLGTGLRVGEFVNLMITDLDFNNSTLKVPFVGKTGNRYVPFPMSLKTKTKLYLNGRRRGYLFVKKDETQYTTRALQAKIKNIYNKAAIDKKLTMHSLRHTYGTILRANGVAIQDIQIYLGHSSVKVTEIYAHLVYDMEQQKQIMNIVDNT